MCGNGLILSQHKPTMITRPLPVLLTKSPALPCFNRSTQKKQFNHG
jgi:hypothetical protein